VDIIVALPAKASPYWGDPVADFASLPATGREGEQRITLDTGTIYYWDGAAWSPSATAATIVAVTDGTPAAAGEVGEIITQTVLNPVTTNVGTTGVWGYVTSVNLTAGEWILTGTIVLDLSAAVFSDSIRAAITASPVAVGLSNVDHATYPYVFPDTSEARLVVPEVIVSITTTTTYYLNSFFTYSSGTPKHAGRLRARRYR